jgi:hypothetical protein
MGGLTLTPGPSPACGRGVTQINVCGLRQRSMVMTNSFSVRPADPHVRGDLRGQARGMRNVRLITRHLYSAQIGKVKTHAAFNNSP